MFSSSTSSTTTTTSNHIISTFFTTGERTTHTPTEHALQTVCGRRQTLCMIVVSTLPCRCRLVVVDNFFLQQSLSVCFHRPALLHLPNCTRVRSEKDFWFAASPHYRIPVVREPGGTKKKSELCFLVVIVEGCCRTKHQAIYSM